MNILFRELKANFKSFVLWTLPLGLLFFLASLEYEAFAGNARIQAAIESFDFLFQALAGGVYDITTPEGYLSLVSIYIYLPLGIFSGMLGSNLIAKEERDKTAEFLFSLPVKRTRVITCKLIVGVMYTLAINIILLLVTYYSFGRLGTTQSYDSFVFNMAIGVFLTQLIFLAIGMGLSAFLKQYKKSGGITIAILMGTFMLHILIGMTDQIDFMKFVTPFKYFSVDLMLAGTFEFQFILLTALLVFGSITCLYYFYNKRDLYI